MMEGSREFCLLESNPTDSPLALQEFILDPLLSGIGARRYAQPAQQFELATACLQHCSLCVRALAAAPEVAGNGATPPGSTVLARMLSPTSRLLRDVLTHVGGATPEMTQLAVDALAAHVHNDSMPDGTGAAAEAAVVALFELLVAVFDADTAWVEAQRRHQHGMEPLHTLLLATPAVAVQLVQFVGYSRSASIQAGAVRTLGALTARCADFTHMVLQLPGIAKKLVYDCARCLDEGLLAPAATSSYTLADSGEGDDGGSGGGASAAELLLQVLLDNALGDFPNFTQLALGYAVQQARPLYCARNAIPVLMLG